MKAQKKINKAELSNLKKENKRLLRAIESHDIVLQMILNSLFDYEYSDGEFLKFTPKKSLFYSKIKPLDKLELNKQKSYFG